uniref:Uncharacterized protein n=1 Tax=Populus trichocarpa TaxID=3694 RepID=U5GMQ6_POPTR
MLHCRNCWDALHHHVVSSGSSFGSGGGSGSGIGAPDGNMHQFYINDAPSLKIAPINLWV